MSLSAAQFAEMVSTRRNVRPRSSYPDSIIYGYMPHESEDKRALEEHLRSLPSLDRYLDKRRQYITCAPHTADVVLSMSVPDAASKVIRGAAIHGVDPAVGALHDYLSTHYVPTKFAYLLAGARITNEIVLDSHCKLVPTSEASHLIEAILDLDLGLSLSQVEQVVGGVLIFDAVVSFGALGVNESTDEMQFKAPSVEFEGIMSAFNGADTFCDLLTLASDRYIYPFAWTQTLNYLVVDTLPISQHTPVGGWAIKNHLTPILRSSSELDSGEVQDIGALVQQYKACDPDTQKKLRVPLSRYAMSKSRLDIMDQYIDLGTAYEALLLQRNAKSKTKRLAERTSRIFSSAIPCRMQVHKDTSTFYGVRSGIVHGQFTGGDHDLYKRAESNFVRCIRYVIKHGGVPDWRTFQGPSSVAPKF